MNINEYSENYLKNPSANNLIWYFENYTWNRLNNDYESKAENIECIFYNKQNKIENR